MNRKLLLYIAVSADGYIAQPNDNLDFLKRVEVDGEDYGYTNFIQHIDTVIIGRKTYDWVTKHVGEAHYANGNNKVYVITRTPRESRGNITFYHHDLTELVYRLKAEQSEKHIFCDGGAEVIHTLLSQRLVDELTLSIVPVLVGDGTRLFKNGRPEEDLELVSAKSFTSGLVQLHYTLTTKG